MMKIVIAVLFFLSSIILNAQKVFENTAITSLVINESGQIRFYKKLNNGLYKEIDFNIELARDDRDFKYKFVEDEDYEAIGYNNIVSDDDLFIDIENIKPISLEVLEKELQSKIFTTLDDNDRYTYFLAHPSFFLEARYDLEYDEFKRYKKKKIGDLNKIYLNEETHYFIHFGNNRYITILDRISLSIYNTKKGLRMVGKNKHKFQTINKNPINRKDLKDIANRDKIRIYPGVKYEIKKAVSGKYIVNNVFNEKVLPLEFDTITLGNCFFIGKIGDNYKIYNSYLKEFPIENVRSAHTYQNQLQILQNNELKILDINGEIFNKRKSKYKHYVEGMCGNTSFSEMIKLMRNDSLYNGAHYLNVERDEYGFKPVLRDFIIDKISKAAILQFLDKTLEQQRSESFLGTEDKVLVNDKGFYGLYSITDSYSLKTINESKDFNYFLDKPDSLPAMNIELTEILPIAYDSIYKSWGRIYFSKNSLYGILGITNDVEFSELKKETSNYYRVADRIGKKGWLSYSEKRIFWDN